MAVEPINQVPDRPVVSTPSWAAMPIRYAEAYDDPECVVCGKTDGLYQTRSNLLKCGACSTGFTRPRLADDF